MFPAKSPRILFNFSLATLFSALVSLSMNAFATTLTMQSPSNGGTISGTITMSVSLSSTSGVNTVEFFRAPYSGGTCHESSATEISWVAPATTSSITFNTESIPNGTYCFYAIAYTTGSPVASNIVWDTDSNPLSLTMLSPANGTRISGTSSSVSVSLTTTSGVSTVNFYRAPYTPSTAACDESHATEIGSAAASTTTSISLNTKSISNGIYCFYAVTSGTAPAAASNTVFPVVSNVPTTCTPISSMTETDPSGWNMYTYFINDPTGSSGPYFGAGQWPNDPNADSWYFINLAYLGFVDLMSSSTYVSQNPNNNVPDYIQYYLEHVNSDYSIGPTGGGAHPDSNDSYAATLLSLAAAYYRVTCNASFFSGSVYISSLGANVEVLAALKSIATNNLVNPRMSFNGGSLVRVFQSAADGGSASAYYDVAYVEDNSEDYEGLADFGNLLTALADSSASTYLNSAALIPPAVAGTYTLGEWNAVPGFENYVSINSNGVVSVANPESPQFYPDGVSGLFPQAHAMAGISESMFSGGWDYLQTYFPDYQTYEAYSSDPWTLLGLAAAYNGNPAAANNILNETKKDGGIPINDMGFYRRIVLYLDDGFVY